jgi:hypothetical protein
MGRRRRLPPANLPMQIHVFRTAAALLLWTGLMWAQPQQVRVEPVHDSGQSVTGAFEGWFANPDGSFSLLFGYFNRNAKEEVDIAIGPNNKLEPGGPDQGQPTHFLPRRQWGVFTLTVPKDFGEKRVTWTLTANGVTTSVPGNLSTLWELAPFKDATGNTPPFIGFSEKGPFVQGPLGTSASVKATMGTPLGLPVWAADDANMIPGATRPRTPPVILTWSKFRGPGSVVFASNRPPVESSEFAAPPKTAFQGKASTSATFSEPGDYILHLAANDWTGEGGRGFQCCWSNAQVRVSVSK